ncbi:MAG: hypothetical protein QOD60_2128, partial [Solirubrobacterales bacterium]|nr:hypothetical protein [Solirubrobacterales bacterium]
DDPRFAQNSEVVRASRLDDAEVFEGAAAKRLGAGGVGADDFEAKRIAERVQNGCELELFPIRVFVFYFHRCPLYDIYRTTLLR